MGRHVYEVFLPFYPFLLFPLLAGKMIEETLRRTSEGFLFLLFSLFFRKDFFTVFVVEEDSQYRARLGCHENGIFVS